MPAPTAPAATVIRPARPSELRHLAEVEASGGAMFTEHLGERMVESLLAPPPSGAERDLDGLVLVAARGADVVGFAHLLATDDAHWGHLEQLSVRPEAQRQGLGSRLVRAVLAEAHWAGRRWVSLCTYRDVPWNGPLYRALGFVDVDEPDGLEPYQARLREHERAVGLDDAGPRVVMARDV